MIRIYAYKKIFNNSKSRLENESSLTLSQNGNTFKVLSQLFQTFARYCTITPANLYLNFSQCQRSDPASRITIRDPLWMDTCRTTKRRSWSEIEKNNKQTSKKRERNDRAKEEKRRVKRCVYKRRYEKKKEKSVQSVEKGGKRSGKLQLRSTRYASEMECKNRNCKMCNCKLGWTNAGIASDVSRRLFHYPYPVHLFFRGFLPTLRNGLRGDPLLSFSILSTIAEEDFNKEIIGLVHKWDTIADAIIETLLYLEI